MIVVIEGFWGRTLEVQLIHRKSIGCSIKRTNDSNKKVFAALLDRIILFRNIRFSGEGLPLFKSSFSLNSFH